MLRAIDGQTAFIFILYKYENVSRASPPWRGGLDHADTRHSFVRVFYDILCVIVRAPRFIARAPRFIARARILFTASHFLIASEILSGWQLSVLAILLGGWRSRLRCEEPRELRSSGQRRNPGSLHRAVSARSDRHRARNSLP